MKSQSYMQTLVSQVRLLIWKRYVESTKSNWEIIRLLVPPVIFFLLIHLAYATLDFFSKDAVEPFLVPIAYFVFAQRIVIQIMYEKSNKLQEAMKMMGLLEPAYWISYFIFDGIIIGFLVSFICAIISGGALFNGANFGEILGLLFIYCLSVVPFCFWITCFFDTPQTAGQAILGILFGFYVVYVIVFLTKQYTIPIESAQIICSFFPPIALQMASGSYLKSYTSTPTSTYCGIMFVDIFIYSGLTWYFSQVWPSKLGIQKPFYFPLLPSYWSTVISRKRTNSNPRKVIAQQDGKPVTIENELRSFDTEAGNENENVEKANESLLGLPTVIMQHLRKSFKTFLAVDDVHFNMYENQIFALLGHNGAGKTTLISMLTGLIPPDRITSSGHIPNASIYGNSILTQLHEARLSMGVCPQHDVLFDNLTVREHILFFAQLKGYSYEAADIEATALTTLFHLQSRLDNTGIALSGGQKRKLSIAIAVCGGSKLVILDEPTAGMDPLARRELWDLLSGLKKGRTMLLTTHYMDEADVLGDRVGIMASGKLICLGSTSFLKRRYGDGYKLILDCENNMDEIVLQQAAAVSNKKQGKDQQEAAGEEEEVDDEVLLGQKKLDYLQASAITQLIQGQLPSATFVVDECLAHQLTFCLPYSETKSFGKLFKVLDEQLPTLGVKNYGLTSASLEEVFLKVDLETKEQLMKEKQQGRKKKQSEWLKNLASTKKSSTANASSTTASGAGAAAETAPSSSTGMFSFLQGMDKDLIRAQLIGVAYRKLLYALNDFSTIPLLMLPIVASIGAGIIYSLALISDFSVVNAVVADAIYVIGYLGIPGILAEFVVRERNDRLKNVLTVMGCHPVAYWLGTLLADAMILSIPMIVMFISWFIIPGMENYNSSNNGCNYFIVFLFNFQIASFAYLMSFLFETPKSAVSYMPTILILLAIFPSFIYSLFNFIYNSMGNENGAPSTIVATIIWWSTLFMSPQGGFYGAFLANGEQVSDLKIELFPPPGVSIVVMIGQTLLFLYFTIYIDDRSIAVLAQVLTDRVVDESLLDEDVVAERIRVLQMSKDTDTDTEKGMTSSGKKTSPVVVVERLRKVYPAVKTGGENVTAVEDIALALAQGEIFGLLGANGAGKTTLLSMLTRLMMPTSGNALICDHSILSSFRTVATNLGVVTQNNSLWDRLSVESHLYLFARLRGVSEQLVGQVVEDCLFELELLPHRKKLSMTLSGGMKRKLCVAIALIGDPKVVLLDEPSAGLDPISRRNLWSVILRTMRHRTVILTTHSMEEAEVLTTRIGIMVRGQLHALGTKQHLKHKFGTGFELVIKLAATASTTATASASSTSDIIVHDHSTTEGHNSSSSSSSAATATAATAATTMDPYHAHFFQAEVRTLTTFLQALFPSTVCITENGGLITFRLITSEVSMSTLFLEMEKHRERLHIEDYSIAQPTLEQVFIHIVQSVTGTTLAEPDTTVDKDGHSKTVSDMPTDTNIASSLPSITNKPFTLRTRVRCGCSDTLLKLMAVITFGLFLSGIVVGGGLTQVTDVGAALSISFAIVFMIVWIVMLSLLFCMSCRYPVEEA